MHVNVSRPSSTCSKFVLAVVFFVFEHPITQAQPHAPGGTLDNKSLVEFVRKHQDVELSKTEFESLNEVSRKLGYLERDFVITFKPDHSEFLPAYKYHANEQRLEFGLGYLATHRRSVIYKDSERLSQVTDPSFIDTPRILSLTYPSVEIDRKFSSRRYVGTNAYGVKADVMDRIVESTGVVFLNVTSERLRDVRAIFETLSPADAKAMVEKLVWRISGRTTVGLWSSPRQIGSKSWAVLSGGSRDATVANPNSFLHITHSGPALLVKLELLDLRTREVVAVIDLGTAADKPRPAERVPAPSVATADTRAQSPPSRVEITSSYTAAQPPVEVARPVQRELQEGKPAFQLSPATLEKLQSGMNKVEVVVLLGKPSSISSMGNGALLQWIDFTPRGSTPSGGHVAILFVEADKMVKITHQFFQNR